jgi:DNA (cytosine-5)-methyltransferase 1
MKALSLFSNVGFGEYYLDSAGIDVVVANELLQDRVDFYKQIHRNQNIICGDICEESVQNSIIKACIEEGGVDLVIATPPCQGMSIANAQKSKDDARNKLIVHAMHVFNQVGARYMLIENVPGMANTFINYNGKPIKIYDFIKSKIPEDFECKTKVLNGKDFGTPQSRSRSICLISKNGEWEHPEPQEHIPTLREAIGDSEEFCSLRNGGHSNFAWHFAPKHNPNHIIWMTNTPTGSTAFNNAIHYPKVVEDGVIRKIKGFKTTYKRMDWDKPAPTVTMTNGSISSQNNVHPGRKCLDGTYSDARVLSVREILAICGLPTDLFDKFAHIQSDSTFKYDYSVNFMRKVLGELFLPKMCLEIVKVIPEEPEQPPEPQLQFSFA